MATTEERQLAEIKQVVELVAPDFKRLAKIHEAVNFEREASFALQALKANPYLARVAAADKDSLKTAILNVAAIGLSLSPVHKLAYLVPRKGKICLDISYRGYIQLAVDCGAIQWALAELVCEKDKFQLRGLGSEPLHEFEPFGDRGNVIGAYCAAKTHGGEFITISMSIKDIHDIRDRSEAWKAYKIDKNKTNPWVTDSSEMSKKTVIRRAYKSWPMTDSRQRMDQVIDILPDPEIVDQNNERVVEPIANHSFSIIHDLLNQIERTEEQFVVHLGRVFKRDINLISELTEIEVIRAKSMLEDIVAKQKLKEAK